MGREQKGIGSFMIIVKLIISWLLDQMWYYCIKLFLKKFFNFVLAIWELSRLATKKSQILI